jgi:hypothetical protein
MLCLASISAGTAADKYIGVESCASSSCHGAKSARDNRNVSQNEYTTWFRFGQHSRSVQTLHSQKAIGISKTLGQPSPWENDSCLGCHSTNAPIDQRSQSFSQEDGISCEACHGPAENWVTSHHRGTNNGSQPRPMWKPDQEAATCLSCHSPSNDKPMTHQMFAAGHPPLSFELVTFGQMQPSHVAYDADYSERKAIPSPLSRWFAGQFASAKNYLARLEKHIPQSQLIVPDGTLFSCDSCHQSAEGPQSSASPNPGALQANTSAIQMLSIAADAAQWESADKLTVAIENWAASTSQSKTAFVDATATLWQLIKSLNQDPNFQKTLATEEMASSLSKALKARVAGGEFKYWANAEQAYYLLGICEPKVQRQGLLESLSIPEQFKPELFQAEFSEID